MMMAVEEWLKFHGSPELRTALEKAMEWRHKQVRLGGFNPYFDAIPGFYGNPEAKTVFVAEIPSLAGIWDGIAKRYETDDTSPLWQSNWNVSEGDFLFRKALMENPPNVPKERRFIPPNIDGIENKPLEWNCWITDFIKCPARTKVWNNLDRSMKNDVKSQSADLLAAELKALNPTRIVMMGGDVESYFRKYFPQLQVRKSSLRLGPHYGRKQGDKRKTEYLAKFRKGLTKRIDW